MPFIVSSHTLGPGFLHGRGDGAIVLKARREGEEKDPGLEMERK